MHRLKLLSAVGAAAFTIGVMPARAAQVITVGTGSGKTIADGVSELHPGDTLQILPGIYHEQITVPCDDVTIESTKPGVVLEGAVALTGKDFSPVAGLPGIYSWQLPADATDARITWIWYNGQPLVYHKTPLDPAKDAWGFHVDQQTRRLDIVTDGKAIPDSASIAVPTLPFLVKAEGRNHVTVRGLDIRQPSIIGISVDKDGDVEDNVVTQAGLFGILAGEKSKIVRNTTKGCSGPGILLGGDGMEIANNLAVANGIQWADYIDWCGTETKMNVRNNCTFEQNWLVDRPMGGLVKVDGHTAMRDGKPVVNKWVLNGGLWPDGDSFNNNYIDNAIARLSHAAIYIEYNANRNIIMANDIQDCAMGITIREGSQNLVTRNWVWDRECLGWGSVNKEGFAGFGPGYDDNGKPITSLYIYDGEQKDPQANRVVAALGSSTWGQQMDDGLSLWHTFSDLNPTSHDNVMSRNLVQVSGVAVSVPLGKYDWLSDKDGKDPEQRDSLSNQLTGNYYTRPSKKTNFALLGRTLVKNITDYRKQTSWDANARVGNFTPDVIGFEPIWTIPSAAVDTTTPVSILHDPTLETFSLQSSGEPLFWHGSNVHTNWEGAPNTKYILDAKTAHSGRCCISVSNFTKADAVPLWWTSSAIPVKPGITMGVDLWVAADGVKPVKSGDGVRAKIRFTDATGHEVGETSLIGDGAHTELTTGSYKYTNVVGQAAAPDGACWMTVCLGDDPSDGTVRFDDIHMSMLNPTPPHYQIAVK